MVSSTPSLAPMPSEVTEPPMPKYFHGLLATEDVEEILKKPGDFLVRSTSVPDQNPAAQRPLVISLASKRANGVEILHVPILANGKAFSVDSSKPYASIPELVNFCIQSKKSMSKSNPESFLVSPISRQDWEIQDEEVIISKKLGESANSNVLIGIWSSSIPRDTNVEIRQISSSSKEEIQKLVEEARLMRNLNHPNVVKFHGLTMNEEPPLLLTEMATYGALTRFLKHEKVINKHCLRFCFEAASAVEYLHAMKLIHRDLRSESFFYTNGTVKIYDFFFARDGPFFTVDSKAPIAARLMAPEVTYSNTFSYKTDVWAYGLLCYEIFSAGGDPFRKMETSEVLIYILDGGKVEFPAKTPANVKDFLSRHVFDHNNITRYSMQQIVSFWENLLAMKRPPYIVTNRPPLKYTNDASKETTDFTKYSWENRQSMMKRELEKRIQRDGRSIDQLRAHFRTMMKPEKEVVEDGDEKLANKQRISEMKKRIMDGGMPGPKEEEGRKKVSMLKSLQEKPVEEAPKKKNRREGQTRPNKKGADKEGSDDQRNQLAGGKDLI